MLPVQIPDWQKIFAGFFNLVLPQICSDLPVLCDRHRAMFGLLA